MRPFDSQESWLHGYSLSGVAGIAADVEARVGPLAKMNFLVGRNNHGKSTLMRAASQWTSTRSGGAHTGVRRTLVPIKRDALIQMLRSCSVRTQEEQASRLSSLLPLQDGWLGAWVQRSNASNTSGVVEQNNLTRHLKSALSVENYSVQLHGGVAAHAAANFVNIPAFRQMRQAAGGGDRADLASGEGLVAELSRWQHPRGPHTPAYAEAKQRWSRLQDFLRDVLEDPDAELEVAEATDLHVRLAQAGSMLHIDSLGDGIKQVVMIAAACIYYDDHLVLLEEPEIHLHAGLQRKLMRFLSDHTSSQYIIATHSAHVLDLPGARIFHVTHDGTSSRVAPAVRASDVQQVCVDLGYMASDLLQSNYTIWVEGPSDRVYWSRWLQLVDPQLKEGVHFTIMSYGGYLIDSVHLRDEPDPATEDLVQLLKLGRQCVVIADSDKTSGEDPLRPTLVRLMDEALRPGSGQVIVCDWVRTVENLVPRELFRRAVIARHPVAGPRLKTFEMSGPFDAPFEGLTKGSYSKVGIAKEVANSLTAADMDDQLATVAGDLAAKIRLANGLPEVA
ncbi:AAA family ATPase [Nocardioides sp. SYSU D00065]|uniref:AAA family ATPase n=1 Tax=Nocardioides sp. SYSU D00065 TaxID=2817378 RepID=UPI001B3361F1|nr:AAA family ATPase [Nocardioides sp. SYSU D00065]